MTPKRETARELWGSELAQAMETAGMTGAQLAEALHVVPATVSQWIHGRRMPHIKDLERTETLLGTNGYLKRNLKWISRETSPEWFEWREVEADATELLNYETVLIPGLLQCASYARAVLPSEELVGERLDRQEQVLGAERPPVYEALLDESILYRRVGGPEVMVEALTHLIEMADRDEIIVRVVPLTAEIKRFTHSFWLAAVNTGKQVAFLDSARKGRIEEQQAEISELRRMWVHFSAEALSRADSAALIQKAIERWSTP
jgi:transcriptional regulator with XRE-family HTH domain